MAPAPFDFYQALAEHYHLLFEDWNRSIERQAATLNGILHNSLPRSPLKLLDCACGIGTQAIGFAQAGHHVAASDICAAAVARARREAEQRGLSISFVVSDMTSLDEIAPATFDAVTALDNALPHLNPSQLAQAARAMHSKLKPQGIILASIRDYDQLITDRPVVHGPAFYGAAGTRRIVHQVWDWIDRERYVTHLYITEQAGGTWASHHFASEYRCLLRGELTSALKEAGFEQVRWLMPSESGYYQPIVQARRSGEKQHRLARKHLFGLIAGHRISGDAAPGLLGAQLLEGAIDK